MRNTARALFVVSIYSTILSYVPGFDAAGQVLTVFLLVFTAFVCMNWVGVYRYDFSVFEMVMTFACLWSVLIGFFTGNLYSISYSFVYFIVLASGSIFARVFSLGEMINLICIAFASIFVTHLGVEFSNFTTALAVQVSSGGLFRFSPMGMHPNLTGLLYAGGAVLFVSRAMFSTRVSERVALLFLALVSTMVIFAASARGSLLALIIIFVVMYFRYYGFGFRAICLGFSGIFFAFIFVYFIGFDSMYLWMSQILEFESDTRGVDSGGTGRSELWAAGLDLLFGNISRFFFGGGFRSAEESVIGFLTENSYLTIYLEFGVFVGSIIIFLFAYSSVEAIAGVDAELDSGQMKRGAGFIAGFVLLLLMAQSFFNRYLIGIGNPLSLSVLFMVVAFSVQKRKISSFNC